MGVHIDASQVDELAVDLSRAPERMKRTAARTMKRSALEIKNKMREDFSGHDYAPSVPRSLEFRSLGGLAYEIGELDSAGPQWGLAAILAFGTSNNAPVVDKNAALRRETPIMVQHLLDGGADSVFGGPE
ncbi:MAG TPA: hypothetical protein VFJ19_07890 [Nocardioidaceae bacterium]|nr:hypothetical protein [Nocardioidaceae bacterium]